MRSPIAFTYGNCVFGRDFKDAWAVFVASGHSYEWLTDEAKLLCLQRLAGALQAVEADIQILRVARHQDVVRYRERAARLCSRRHAGAARDYIRVHAERLEELDGVEPATFFAVSLREPTRDVSRYVSTALERGPRGLFGLLARSTPLGEGHLLSAAALERCRVRAEQARVRLAAYLPVRAARGVELQWLVRRAFCRGLGEPRVDGLHEPRALAFERDGQAMLAPLRGEVARWMEGYVEHRPRELRVDSELGESWQAMLVLGALPERARFPGPAVELMFTPLERLSFGVDVTLNARFLPNDLAVRLARRRVQDADQIARAEADGEQGVTDAGHIRTEESRDLLTRLQSSDRPPLLRATVSLAVGASSERQLEERVEQCRRAYGEIALHRPPGDQLRLFVQHLPAQRTAVAGYDDTLTVEQVGAMVPTATHAVGSLGGFHLGHTLTGSRRPVRFNLSEGSERDRNAAILSVGALGSGKTTLAQKLQYEAFLRGARVIDCDPKGDHRFHLLDEVAPHAETICLRDDPALRGVLDPLRVAPAQLRQEAAVSFLCDLLPGRADPAWETAVVAAVDRVIASSRRPGCREVVRALLDGREQDVQVGRALEVYSRSGLAQLGFADGAIEQPSAGDRQVTYIAIRDLPGPEPGTARSEYTQAERLGAQLTRLIAMYAMNLISRERERLKVFCWDEGWRLLGDPVGRALLGSLQRLGRSELAVPIISTQLLSDALVGQRDSLENLLGATFVFGMRSESEAARALRLLGLDPDDRRARSFLLELQAGGCLMRDHFGRIEAVQVELVAPTLVRELSTTPRAHAVR